MTIAIITQPLASNYGGLLQNWALQQVLKQQYPLAQVITFDQTEWTRPWHIKYGGAFKRLLGLSKPAPPSDFDRFRTTHISATPKAETLSALRRLDKQYAPDAYIVGSDQVWRPRMVNHLEANFLQFTHCPRKIAYAASFGVDSWEFSEAETKLCRRLAAEFSAMSVREEAGIDLCRTHLATNAQWVLDPTLLLSADDYDRLLPSEELHPNREYAFTYILDSSPAKQQIVSSLLQGVPEIAAAHNAKGESSKNRMSVEQWIAGVRNARFVVCDSFHGVAFSIIYNKEFCVLLNPARGNSRIESILKAFGLECRIIHSPEAIPTHTSPIDWERVNRQRRLLSHSSTDFLFQALK